jgi:amino acid adenylation domain-containing protein
VQVPVEGSTTDGTMLDDLVLAAAAERPAETAVLAADGCLTYGELDDASARLADELRELGAGPETQVAISVHRSTRMVVAILGVLRSGAAYVPLDPGYPPERREQTISLASPLAVVDDAGVSPSSSAPADAARARTPTDAAYVIFTSGSSGTPKGVVVQHDQARWSTTARHQVYRDRPPGRFLLLSSVAFDSSVAGIFWTLSSGGTLIVPSDEDAADPDRIAAQVLDRGVTHLLTVPTIYAAFVGQTAGSRLTTVIVAGEECSSTLARNHASLHPDAALFNEYGPTEASVWTTWARIDAGRPVTIGVEVDGAVVRLLDEQMREVADGERGQIWIGGMGVARGYLDRPDLTSARFRPDPFDGAGGRIYATGDVGRRAPSGELEYLGRLDRQVQVGGARVDPGEVEAALETQSTAIEVAAVVPTEADGGSTRLAAFVIAAQGSVVEPTAERRALARRVPRHMVPDTITVLDEMPRLPNGKIDRGALGGVDRGAPPPAAPMSEGVTLICRLCRDVLSLAPEVQLQPNDSVFSLGGTSLDLMRLRRAIARTAGVELSLEQMLTEPSFAELGTALDGEPGER